MHVTGKPFDPTDERWFQRYAELATSDGAQIIRRAPTHFESFLKIWKFEMQARLLLFLTKLLSRRHY